VCSSDLDWVGWGQFGAFWDQHVRWVMRPSGSANVSVATETRGEHTNVIITALDDAGESLNFADFVGRVVMPDLSAETLRLRQTGPGRYEGSFDAGGSGSYLLSLRYESRDETGEITDRGFVQSAITRPFADEHRSIEDNTPLLVQVAEMTGGRVLDRDPTRAELFSRTGLTMPVSLRPIWLVFALSSLAMFLVDVGVRRVRLDFPAMARSIGKLGVRSKGKTVEQVGALRAAKAKTQETLSDRGAGTLADRKFEASEELQQSKGAGGGVVDAPAGSSDDSAMKKQGTTSEPKGRTSSDGDGDEGGMSRLLKAKRRAQDTYDQDKNEQP